MIEYASYFATFNNTSLGHANVEVGNINKSTSRITRNGGDRLPQTHHFSISRLMIRSRGQD